MENYNNFQRAVQNFGNQSGEIEDYVANFDSNFYSNWQQTLGVKQRDIDTVQNVVTGLGDAYVAAKAIKGIATGVFSGEESTEATTEEATEELPEVAQETSLLSGETALTGSSATINTGSSLASAQQAIMDADPEDLMSGLITEGTTVGTSLETTATEGASALSSALDTAGTVLAGAGDIASTALDFLGPVGLIAGLGISIAELVDPPKRPSAPPTPLTASSKSSMVIPSFDSVVDTPATNSAF